MTLATDCRRVAKILAQRKCRVVFAESCTGGLIAASLARIPGISNYLCGSQVTYRNDSKHRWLGVSAQLLEGPGPVSAEVAAEMATGVLKRTPEADVAAAVTGYLGPDSPRAFDGVVFISIAGFNAQSPQRGAIETAAWQETLSATGREARQREAASLVLGHLWKRLAND